MTDIIACKKALKWIDVPTSRLKILLEREARAGDFFVFSAPTTGTGNVKRRSTRNSTEWTPNCTTATWNFINQRFIFHGERIHATTIVSLFELACGLQEFRYREIHLHLTFKSQPESSEKRKFIWIVTFPMSSPSSLLSFILLKAISECCNHLRKRPKRFLPQASEHPSA